MRIRIAVVTPRKQGLKSSAAADLVNGYIRRSSKYAPVVLELFESEEALFANAAKRAKRIPARLVLLDSSGKSYSSNELAAMLGTYRDAGGQELVLAVGPANGWSKAGLSATDLVVSLGRITLPHELALVVLAEQLYRSLTILAGHPYHTGH